MGPSFMPPHQGSGLVLTSIPKQASVTNTRQDFHASLIRAGTRRAGVSSFKVDSTPAKSCPPLTLSKQPRRHSRQASSTNGVAATTAATTSAAAGGSASASEWVWSEGLKEGVVEQGEVEKRAQPRQQQQRGVSAHEPAASSAAAGVGERTNKPADILKGNMFAGVASRHFGSSCSTQALTDSTTSSPKDYNFDDPFLHRLSDISLMFPEPPTRPPGEIANSSSSSSPSPPSSRALTILGLSKNITSTLPSVQLLLPLRWRKHLRAAASKKRCRKSSSRWVARAKATSSMSETSFLVRALSMSDNKVSLHKNRRGKKTMAGNGSSSAMNNESAALAPPRRELSKLSEGAPSQLGRVTEEADQQRKQRQQEQEQQQQQREQQLEQQQHLERLHSDRTVPSALPTPLLHQALQSPPPAPLHTAPRPPMSRQQQQEQVYNVAMLLAARRHSSRHRRHCFASSTSVASAKEKRFAAPSPSSSSSFSPRPSPQPQPLRPYMSVKNRLASSSSSIFEEDGDDSKRTLFLNPYSCSPLPEAATRTAGGPAPAAAAAAAANAGEEGRASSSNSWVWEHGFHQTCATPAQQPQQSHDQHHQQSVFSTGPVDGFERRAAMTLHIEANRQYGDMRRRIKNGESGIWLPSPGIWSSARRPTPLDSGLFFAW